MRTPGNVIAINVKFQLFSGEVGGLYLFTFYFYFLGVEGREQDENLDFENFILCYVLKTYFSSTLLKISVQS